MNYPKKENGMYVLSIMDQEELHCVAEDVLVGLRYYSEDLKWQLR